MISEEETKKRMQVLRLAQMILQEESENRFNQEYKSWLAAVDATGIKQPIPIPAASPTEEEIVARALAYYKSAEEANPALARHPASGNDSVRKIFAAPAVYIDDVALPSSRPSAPIGDSTIIEEEQHD